MLRTRSGLPKNCSWWTDRHGKRRVRYRKGALTVYLSGVPWGEPFMRAYAAAQERVAGEVGAVRTLPGSVNALALSYYASADFRALSKTTAAVRRYIIDGFRDQHGCKPVRDLSLAHVERLVAARAEKTAAGGGPEAANSLRKTLRVVLGHALRIGMVTVNPVVGVKKLPSARGGEGFHTWTEQEIAQFEARHPVGTRARLALALGLFTAQRRGDVLRMGFQHVSGDLLAVRQGKTNANLLIPIVPELAAILAVLPRTNMTFLMTVRGAPFTAAGFADWFRRECNAAGLPHCSFHGLRKSAAVRLAVAGCSIHEIASITGHRTLGEVARYTRAADQEKLAREAVRRAEGEQKSGYLRG